MLDLAAQSKRVLHAQGKAAIEAFVTRQQMPDGSFCDRTGKSDLYYTVFGLSCLVALDRPLPTRLPTIIPDAQNDTHLDYVHLAAAARCCAWIDGSNSAQYARRFRQRLEAFRSADGGYNHQRPNAPTGTVYGAFLAHLVYQETGEHPPHTEALSHGLPRLRATDGGFSNATGEDEGTATATAAAILIQQNLKRSLDPKALDFLQRCECTTGGFLAFAHAPMPDLLSTATGLYAYSAIGHSSRYTEAHEAFICSLWCEDGGFCGQITDFQTDVEYTFYALLALGALAK